MKSEKEKWIDDVFESVKGSRRAKPDPVLLEKIEREIYRQEARIIPLRRFQLVAAVVLLLLLNIFTIIRYSQRSTSNQEMVADATSEQQLISNYNLYE